MPAVSVIIPNYNRAGIIGETIENMLSQSLPPHEVIVVDDGSTDHSCDIIRSYGPRVTLLTQSNRGPGAARNAGLNLASGEFIQFMDSDDLASRNKLEVQVKALNGHRADLVYGPWVKVWKNNSSIRLQNVVLQQSELPPSRTPLCWFLTRWSMVFQQCLVRRSLLQQVGGYREDLKAFEDGDLFVKLMVAGGKLIYEPESLTFYRLDDHGKLTASGSQQSGRTADEARFYASIISLADTCPELHQCVQQRSFAARVWNVLQESHQNGGSASILQQYLSRSGINNKAIYDAQRWISIKKSGIQQLLTGHRWAACYKAGALTARQAGLIHELGWQLTS